MISACSIKPYLKETDLPNGIKLYSADKQFVVHPDCYWKLRPVVEIGRESIDYNYLKQLDAGYKNISLNVIGELVDKQNKFFVVNWQPHGYFFILEDDYIFVNKFIKYLIPLDYGNDSYHPSAYENQLFPYYKESGRNLNIILDVNLSRSLLYNNIPISNIRYSQINNKIIQLAGYNGFANEFLNFTACPLFAQFSKGESLLSIHSLAVETIGEKPYTNQHGLMFMGVQYQTKFIIVWRNGAFYALPCIK